MNKVATFAVQARKFLVAATGAVAQLVAFGLIDGEVERWTSGIIAALTALLVWLVPNGDAEARKTLDGETVAGEASPLPTGTPVKVEPVPGANAAEVE